MSNKLGKARLNYLNLTVNYETFLSLWCLNEVYFNLGLGESQVHL